MSYQKLMQKVAEVAPKHHEFIIKTAEEVKASPFFEEISTELDGLMKKAFQMPGWASEAGKSFAGGAGAVGGAVAAGIAYALAGDLYDAAKRGITKSRNYQAMLSENPDLKQLPAKNVQKTFAVLHRLNPEFASDPTIAGAWVKRQAVFGEDSLGDAGNLKQLVDARKGLTDVRRLPNVPQVPGQKGKTELGGQDRGKLDELIKHMKLQQDAASLADSGIGFHPGHGGSTRTTPYPPNMTRTP